MSGGVFQYSPCPVSMRKGVTSSDFTGFCPADGPSGSGSRAGALTADSVSNLGL